MAIKYGNASAAWTDVTTPLASSGWVNVSIDTAVGTLTSATTWQQNPVENEKFNIWIYSTGTNVGTSTGQFVTGAWGTGSRVFRYSISWLTNTGATFCRAIVGSPVTGGGTNVSLDTMSKYCHPIKPSTKYKVTYRINVTAFTIVGTSAGIQPVVDEYSSAWVRTVQSSGFGALRTTPTNGFIYETFYFTSGASSAFLNFMIYMISGNGSVDLDYNIFSIDEIAEPVGNALTSTSPSLVSVTAVWTTNNVDQMQITNTSTISFVNTAQYQAQQFTPTKWKFVWVVFMKKPSVWSPTWDMIFKILNDNLDSPWTTVMASYTMPSATYNALANNMEFTVYFPNNLTAGTKYWIAPNYSISSATDYPVLWAVTPSSYSGLYKYGTDGVTYGTTYNGDMYFKTLYYEPTTNFEVSQNNSNVVILSDENGFLEWSVINFQTGKFTWDSWIGSALYNTKPYYADYSKTWWAWRWYPTTWNRIYSAWANEEWVWKLPPWLTNIDFIFASTVSGWSTIDVSSSIDWSSYTVALSAQFVGTARLLDGARFVKIKSNGSAVKLESITISADINLSGQPTLYNYPTNKDIIETYSKSFTSSDVTSLTYRVWRYWFPAIEYGPLGIPSTSLAWRYEMLGSGNDTSWNGNHGSVSWTTTFGSTSNRNYVNFAGDRLWTAATGTRAELIIGNKMNFNHTNDFSWNVTCSVSSLPSTDTSWILWSTFWCTLHVWTVWQMYVWLRIGWTIINHQIGSNYWATRLWEIHNVWFTMNPSELKYYIYLDGVLQNAWWSAVTGFNTTNNWYIGDNAIIQWAASSCQKRVYGVRIFGKQLTAADHLALTNAVLETQFLRIDPTATWSAVSFSELGSSYTVMTDWTVLPITPTSNPSFFAKINITANRLYLSSNNYNSASDKKGSLKQSVTYQVKHLTGPTLKYNIGRASNLISYWN